MGRGTNVVLISWAILHLSQVTQAGPLQRAGREIREVYPEIDGEKLDGGNSEVCIVGDVVYGIDEEIPSEQPCLRCKCQPPGVHCETTRCAKKPGCRAIHKPNQCCPDYQCECEHKGKTYANGERLETVPGGECKVCYCRGGEVQCADVSCYIRTDCEGRTVAGQCCPKYDHCPPKAPSLDANQSNTKITESNTPHPMPQGGSANVTNENEIETTRSYENGDDAKSAILTGLNGDNPTTEYSVIDKNETAGQMAISAEKEAPGITIREIIPEVKEIAITGPPNKHAILIDGRENVDDDVHNNDLVDADTESSEILESYQPPPVLRIGDKLLFLKKGEFVPEKDVSTPSPVITIIGAEGLQRGFEESLENHEVNVNENLEKNNSATEDDDDDVFGSESVLVEERVERPTKEGNPKREISASNGPPKQLVDAVEKESATVSLTVATDEDRVEAGLPDENLTSIDIDNTTIDIAVEIPTVSTVLPEATTEADVFTTARSATVRTTEIGVAVKDADEVVENPEYPPLPDVMNLPNVEVHTDDPQTVAPKILPDVLPMRSNKTVENGTHSEWLKAEDERIDLAQKAQNLTDKNQESDGKEYRSEKTSEITKESASLANGHILVNKAAALDDTILSQVAPSDLILTTTEPDQEPTGSEMIVASTQTIDKDIAQLIQKYSQLTDAVGKLKGTTESSGIATEIPNSTPLPIAILQLSSDRSVESLEALSSETREVTTPAGTKTSATENASIETENISLSSGEVDDGTTEIVASPEPTAKPETSKSVNFKDMVEVLPQDTPGLDKDNLPKDVEVVDDGPKVNERLVKKVDEDPVFQELNQELDVIDHPEKYTKSPEDEKAEAELIFKELLDEIDGTKSGSKGREADKVSRVIAKYNVKNTKQSLDTSLLGILREFINSQRLYNQHP